MADEDPTEKELQARRLRQAELAEAWLEEHYPDLPPCPICGNEFVSSGAGQCRPMPFL